MSEDRAITVMTSGGMLVCLLTALSFIGLLSWTLHKEYIEIVLALPGFLVATLASFYSGIFLFTGLYEVLVESED